MFHPHVFLTLSLRTLYSQGKNSLQRQR